MRMILINLARFYKKFISPFIISDCKFYPTCCEYFCEAIFKHGVLNGLVLSSRRILKCNLFCKSCGYDPVP